MLYAGFFALMLWITISPSELLRVRFAGELSKNRLTCLSECLIGESGLPHNVCMPFVSLDYLVDVYDIEMFVHPQLMAVIANEYSPVLRWVWVFPNRLGNLFTKTSLLSEPFPT